MKLRNGLTTTSEINWSSLPSHIVAKIVHFTSCAERQRKQKVTNQRFTTIRHFASVCNRWRAAILASRVLFVNIDFPENVNFKYDNSISGLTIHFLDRSSRKMVDHEKTKLVVKKGYLQVAECVVLHHHHDPNIVYLLCEFANRNFIKRFHVETWKAGKLNIWTHFLTFWLEVSQSQSTSDIGSMETVKLMSINSGHSLLEFSTLVKTTFITYTLNLKTFKWWM